MMKFVRRQEFAERLGVSANTVRDRFKEHETRDEHGRIAYPAEVVETALQLDAEVAEYDADCTVTPQSFAEQLGWHPKSVINKFRAHARIVDKKLMFPAAFVAKVVAEQGFDASAYTVSVADAAKQLHCSQQSVKTLLRRKGKLRGKKLFYNAIDVLELAVKRDDERWCRIWKSWSDCSAIGLNSGFFTGDASGAVWQASRNGAWIWLKKLLSRLWSRAGCILLAGHSHYSVVRGLCPRASFVFDQGELGRVPPDR